MDRLSGMEAFARAVETGSFSAAGESLGLSPQAVGKQVRLLEEHLGVRLIHRTTRRQSLTEAGRDLYERVRIILAEVEAVEAVAARSQAVPRGQIRVNAPVTFGAYDLARVLPAYLAAYPEVDVELTLSDRKADLIEEGYEVVFRVGPPAGNGLIARPLRPMDFALCAAPSYLAAWTCLLALPAGALPVAIMIERADAWRPQPETALLETLRGLLALMPVAALLALPIPFLAPLLYPWMHAAEPDGSFAALCRRSRCTPS